MEINLKQIYFGGVTLQIPEVWTAETEMYDEPDGRQCACIDVSAEEGDIRSIMISYGPMPEGSDALMEVNGTFEEFAEDVDTENTVKPSSLARDTLGFSIRHDGIMVVECA